jgi:hypothetical protein
MLIILDYNILAIIINHDNAVTEVPSALEYTERSTESTIPTLNFKAAFLCWLWLWWREQLSRWYQNIRVSYIFYLNRLSWL